MLSRGNLLLVGSAVLGLMACNVPSRGKAVLETDLGTYEPWAPQMVRVENESLQKLGYQFCRAELQRHEGESWTPVSHPLDEPCHASGFLRLGESATMQWALDDSFTAGEYRYVMVVEWEEDGVSQELVSNSFRVVLPSHL